MRVEVIKTEELGDRSYVAHDGAAAIVVDPQRDLDRVERVLAEAGLRLSLVLETHIHNDYVTGGYELCRRTGARYGLPAEEDLAFAHVPVRDGDELRAGRLRVTAVHTPGHTDTHLAYVVRDTGDPGQAPAVFTGGSLQFGGVGRTDLVDAARTHELAHAQYHSARRLAGLLPDDAPIYPTHGFGSFCSAGSADNAERSTMGEQRRANPALTVESAQRFVDDLVAGLTAYPAYYAHVAPLNRRGPAEPDLSPPDPVDPGELAKRISAGEWVIDLRSRTAHAADHVRGSVGVELADDFATYVGWLIPWGAPLTLIGSRSDEVAAAQRQLCRIGIDRLAGAAHGDLDEVAGDSERGNYAVVDFAAAARRLAAGDVILDVRREEEHRGAHITGALNVPIHQLLTRLRELPERRTWVHCATGYRAGIAASLLDRAHHDVVLIDDEFGNAETAGLPLTTAAEAFGCA